MTALDAVGPYEVLARPPGAEVKFVATTPGPIQTDVGMVLTAAGVSAGIDMALRLAAAEAGEARRAPCSSRSNTTPIRRSTPGRWRRPTRRPGSARPR